MGSIRRMARIFVEGWSPEYGAPLDPDEALAPAEGSVDTSIETEDWAPRDGVDDGVARIAFAGWMRGSRSTICPDRSPGSAARSRSVRRSGTAGRAGRGSPRSASADGRCSGVDEPR